GHVHTSGTIDGNAIELAVLVDTRARGSLKVRRRVQSTAHDQGIIGQYGHRHYTRRNSLIRLQHREERLLGDLDLADLLHALLAPGLLRPQFAFTRDVAAVALRGHVLLHRADRLARDDPAADRRLNRDLEQVAIDLRAQLLHQFAATRIRKGAV